MLRIISLAMLPVTFGLLFGSYCGLVVFVGAQPIFPDGVEAITKSMSTRQRSIVSAVKDDKDKVKLLARGASAALEDDLLEEAAQRDLQQALPIPSWMRDAWPAVR